MATVDTRERDPIPPHAGPPPKAPEAGGTRSMESLEYTFGKPRSAWTAGDLVRFAQERNIRLLALMHVGGDGRLKVLDFAPRDSAHLAEILAGGDRADGSNIISGIKAGSSDLLLKPRPRAAFLDPFSPVPTLVVLCRHADREGNPLSHSPDTIVRKAADRVQQELGVELWSLGEVEFFLGREARKDDAPRKGDSGYHAASPVVFGEELRREALMILSAIGVPTRYAHSEVGVIDGRESDGMIWEQHEIELGLAPLPVAADAVVLTRWVLENLAQRRGYRCSFDPVVRAGHAGNGLHFHLSPRVSGEPMAVFQPDDSLTDAARWLIGGLVRTAGALMAFGNREHSSFVRLKQGKEAPTSVTWGRFDRRALIRLPVVPTTDGAHAASPPTIEFRLPDGSAHPHLVLAGVAQAMVGGRGIPGLDELLRKTTAGARIATGDSLPRVPDSFAGIAAALEEQRGVLEGGGVFPATFIDHALPGLRK